MANLLTYGESMSELASAARNKNRILEEGAKVADQSKAGRSIALLLNNKSISREMDAEGVNRLSVTPDFFNNMSNWDQDTTDLVFGSELKRYISKNSDGDVTYKRNQKVGNPIEAKRKKDGTFPVPISVLQKLEANPKDPTLLALKEEYESGDKLALGIPTITKERRIKFLTRNRTDDPSDTMNYVTKESFAAFTQARLNQLDEQRNPEAFSENAEMAYVSQQLKGAKNMTNILSETEKQLLDAADDSRLNPFNQTQIVGVISDKLGDGLPTEVKDGFHEEKTDVEETNVEETDVEETGVEETGVEETGVEETDVAETDVTGPGYLPANWMQSTERAETLATINNNGPLIDDLDAQIKEIDKEMNAANPNRQATANSFASALAETSNLTDPEDKKLYDSLVKQKRDLTTERINANAMIRKLDQLAKDDSSTDANGIPIPTAPNLNTIDDIDPNDPNAGILTSRQITTSENVQTGLKDGSLANVVLTNQEVENIQVSLSNQGVETTADAAKKVATGEIRNPMIVAMGLVNALTGADGRVMGMDRKEALNYMYNSLVQGVPSSADPATVLKNNRDFVVQGRTIGQVDVATNQKTIELQQNNRKNNLLERQADQTDVQLGININKAKVDRQTRSESSRYKFLELRFKERDFMKVLVDQQNDEYKTVNLSFGKAYNFLQAQGKDKGLYDAEGKQINEGAQSDLSEFLTGYKAIRDAVRYAAGPDYNVARTAFNNATAGMIFETNGQAGLHKFTDETFLHMTNKDMPEHNKMLEHKKELAYMSAYQALNATKNFLKPEWWRDIPRANEPNFSASKIFQERIAIRVGSNGLPIKVVALILGNDGTFVEAEESIPYNVLKNKIGGDALQTIINNAPIIGQGTNPKTSDWLRSQPSLINHIQTLTNSSTGG